MTVKEEILSRLRRSGVPFEHYEHAAAPTMEDCLALPYAAPDVTFCKNILLCNRQQTAFYLYVMPPEKPFRTAEASKRLGSSRLSFAPPDALETLLHTPSGSLSPLTLWLDDAQRIRLALDREIRRDGRIAFHPGDNTATVIFRQEDFFARLLPSLGHEPLWL